MMAFDAIFAPTSGPSSGCRHLLPVKDGEKTLSLMVSPIADAAQFTMSLMEAVFSPLFTGRSARQGDEGQRQLSTGWRR